MLSTQSIPLRPALTFAVLAGLCPLASGQGVSLTLTGSTTDYFGSSVAGIGDIDGDGFDDLAVGSYYAQGVRGRLEVFSGATGERLRLHEGVSAAEHFGETVAGVGDVNGDGYPDYAGGARQAPSGGVGPAAGAVRVYSGYDGALIYAWAGPSQNDQLGSSLSAAGDVNGDGFDDVIAGGFTGSGGGPSSGLVQVFSGADGSVLYSFDGDAPVDELGISVSGAGDVNRDGFSDFMAGATGHDANGAGSGLVRIWSGADGELLHEFKGASAGDGLGLAVSDLGDVDGDGYADVALSAFSDGSASSGATFSNVQVVSGRTGDLIFQRMGAVAGDWFGLELDAAGDVDVDGVPDLIVGSYRDAIGGFFSGGAYVLSGRTGETLFSVHGEAPQSYTGWSVAGAGDTDGDGIGEVIVGTLRNSSLQNAPGSAIVYSFVPRGSGIACMGEVNSSGQRATLVTTGTTTVANNDLTLVADDLPARSSVVFLNSRAFGITLNPAIGNTVSAGNLCLAQFTGGGIGRHRPVSAGAGATVALTLDLQNIPAPGPGYRQAALVGETWYWQGWYRDNAAASYSNFTDAIVVTFD